MSKRMIAAIAALAVSAVPASAQDVKVGLVLPYTGVGAELGAADGPRHGALSQAQCRSGQALQDHPHQARLQGAGRRRGQDRGAGIADPGQGRCARRLGLFAGRHRLGAGRHRRQEARGHHECRHLVHHQPVAGLRAHLVHACGIPATRWARPPPRRCMPRPRSSPIPIIRPARTAWMLSRTRSRPTAAR